MAKRGPRAKPSGRERKAAILHAKGATQKKALVQAGYSESFARKCGYQVFQRPVVQSVMTDALEKQNPGIIQKAAQRLDECLDAEKYFSVMTGRGEDKKLEIIAKPDADVRLKACDRVIEAYGAIPGKMEIPLPPRPPINITFIVKGGGSAHTKPQTIVDLKAETAPRPKLRPFSITVKRPAQVVK